MQRNRKIAGYTGMFAYQTLLRLVPFLFHTEKCYVLFNYSDSSLPQLATFWIDICLRTNFK